MDLQILVALLGEQLDKLPLRRRLALVAVRAVFHRLVGGDDGIFRCGGDDIKCTGQSISHPWDKYRSILAFV